MDKINSLKELGIAWKGRPINWSKIPRDIVPFSSIEGKVYDVEGNFRCELTPVQLLGTGTFGYIEEYKREDSSGNIINIAVKRANHSSIDLFYEALFQWQLHKEMEKVGLGSAVPKVYDIFRYTNGDIWFSMECFHPLLLSQWCVQNLNMNPNLFPLLLLQISLILEVLENKLKIDHRDLKVNNMLILNKPITLRILYKGEERTIKFPFRVIIIDFGYACVKGLLDIKESDGFPPFDPCPKIGRDIFQVLVSIWSIRTLREFLGAFWGGYIREKIRSANDAYVHLTENSPNLDWMYNVTEDRGFRAPKCAPGTVIQECIESLE